ncbi:hypothetical protein MKX01_024807 [Papaver californicum]|nr:hypothetical protein MKX01_024807 [Papaver californicum]
MALVGSLLRILVDIVMPALCFLKLTRKEATQSQFFLLLLEGLVPDVKVFKQDPTKALGGNRGLCSDEFKAMVFILILFRVFHYCRTGVNAADKNLDSSGDTSFSVWSFYGLHLGTIE